MAELPRRALRAVRVELATPSDQYVHRSAIASNSLTERSHSAHLTSVESAGCGPSGDCLLLRPTFGKDTQVAAPRIEVTLQGCRGLDVAGYGERSHEKMTSACQIIRAATIAAGTSSNVSRNAGRQTLPIALKSFSSRSIHSRNSREPVLTCVFSAEDDRLSTG